MAFPPRKPNPTNPAANPQGTVGPNPDGGPPSPSDNGGDGGAGGGTSAPFMKPQKLPPSQFAQNRDVPQIQIDRIEQPDTHVNIEFCLAGETRFMTQQGARTLRECAGTKQMVLNHKGNWTPAEIKSFGRQRLLKLTLTRHRVEKVIYATPEHRWFIYKNPRAISNFGFYDYDYRKVVTSELKPGDKLPSRYPKSKIGRTHPSPFGIAHGFVFGDGCLDKKDTKVVLWGEKDKALLKYFAECSTQLPITSINGAEGIEIKHLPAFFKDFPSLQESPSYLLGWLAGYFAADGCVDDEGQISIGSVHRENLEFIQDLCDVLGIAAKEISVCTRDSGYRKEAEHFYNLTFFPSSLTDEFFLVEKHRRRFAQRIETQRKNEATRWRVVSIEETDRFEEVYCAVVPDGHAFVIDGHVLTGNCMEQAARVLEELAENQEDPTWLESHRTLAEQWLAMAQALMQYRIDAQSSVGEAELKQQQLYHQDEMHQQTLAQNDQQHLQSMKHQDDMHQQSLKQNDAMHQFGMKQKDEVHGFDMKTRTQQADLKFQDQKSRMQQRQQQSARPSTTKRPAPRK